MLEMTYAEAAILGIELQSQLPFVQGFAIAFAEEGQDQLSVSSQPVPVDVEGYRVGRELAPFDHREPPRMIVAEGTLNRES